MLDKNPLLGPERTLSYNSTNSNFLVGTKIQSWGKLNKFCRSPFVPKLKFSYSKAKANTWETSVGWKEMLLYSGGWQHGEKKDLCPRTNSKVFKGIKGKLTTVNHLRRGSESSLFSTADRLFWLVGGKVTGWCSRKLALSLKLPSSSWVGALIPAEELRGTFMCILWGRTWTLLYGALLFLDCFPFVFVIPPFPD